MFDWKLKVTGLCSASTTEHVKPTTLQLLKVGSVDFLLLIKYTFRWCPYYLANKPLQRQWTSCTTFKITLMCLQKTSSVLRTWTRGLLDRIYEITKTCPYSYVMYVQTFLTKPKRWNLFILPQCMLYVTLYRKLNHHTNSNWSNCFLSIKSVFESYLIFKWIFWLCQDVN